MVPFDTQPPMVTSGIRIGTPALTTRGFKEDEMKQIAVFIHLVLSNYENEVVLSEVREKVKELSASFTIYDFI